MTRRKPNRKQRRAHLQRPMRGETVDVVSFEVEPHTPSNHIADALSNISDFDTTAFAMRQMGESLTRLAAINIPSIDLNIPMLSGITPMTVSAQHVFSAEITTPFEGTADVSIGRQENEFVPRLAHCHPSHRWTRREDDSVELWCACGAHVSKGGTAYGSCSVHDALHRHPMHDRYNIPISAEIIERLTGMWDDSCFYMPRTEVERCEWAGVEWLSDNYQDSWRSVPELDAERERRDRVEESSRIVHHLVAHREWGQRIKASALGVRPTLTEIDAYRHNVSRINVPRGRSGCDYVDTLIDEYHQHGGIVRHFGFGQDPHE